MPMRLTHFCLTSFVLLMGISVSSVTNAEISGDKPLHHFFNARLLEPGDMQISVFTNAKLGLTGELELGTNGLLDTFGYYNLSLKHKMFVGENFQTSFNSHSFFTRNLTSRIKDAAFLSMHGVITTNRLKDHQFINWGLMDVLVFIRSSTRFDIETMHVPTAVLGMDYVISPGLAISMTGLKPVYKTDNLESDDLEFHSDANLFKDPTQIPGVGILSLIMSFETLNVELNGILVGYAPAGYLNMWWRF